MNWLAVAAIYKFEMSRWFRTLGQSIASPVISTSLYFIVFGAAIGSRMSTINGVPYGVFIVPFSALITRSPRSVMARATPEVAQKPAARASETRERRSNFMESLSSDGSVCVDPAMFMGGFGAVNRARRQPMQVLCQALSNLRKPGAGIVPRPWAVAVIQCRLIRESACHTPLFLRPVRS